MMKTLLVYFIIACMLCFTTDKKGRITINDIQPNVDAAVSNQKSNSFDERIDTSNSVFSLSAIRVNSEIILKYKMNYDSSMQEMKFRFNDYSDITFPNSGIGIILKNGFSKSKISIIHDSLLFLPIIAMNNSLSLYVINLRTKDIIVDDLRTYLGLFWIDLRKDKVIKLLSSETPIIKDTSYIYKINIDKFVMDKFTHLKTVKIKSNQAITTPREWYKRILKL